jgi:hypothetical protein
MLRYLSIRIAFLQSVVFSLAFSGGVLGNLITFSIGGDNTPASIQATVDDFRAALGDPNNGNAPGPLASGRREINWDGGGAVTSSPSLGTTFDVFLNTRGARSTTQAPGTGFNQALPADLSSNFGFFSPNRIFSPVSGPNLTDVFNITDVSFFIPGANPPPAGAVPNMPATVSGFGAVFTGVDMPNSTSIQFFGASNNLLSALFVEPGTVPNGSLSFLGVVGDAGEQIARVRITSGNSVDPAAMDDFLYAEPRGVPESGSGVTLLGLAVGFLLFWYRRSLAVS